MESVEQEEIGVQVEEININEAVKFGNQMDPFGFCEVNPMNALHFVFNSRYSNVKNSIKIASFPEAVSLIVSINITNNQPRKIIKTLENVCNLKMKGFSIHNSLKTPVGSIKVIISPMLKILPNLVNDCHFSHLKINGMQFSRILTSFKTLNKLKLTECRLDKTNSHLKPISEPLIEKIEFMKCKDFEEDDLNIVNPVLESLLKCISEKCSKEALKELKIRTKATSDPYDSLITLRASCNLTSTKLIATITSPHYEITIDPEL
ncbi:unnamed protein product [Moneuplotes crassus]|uniref:Uncharacterized protein n=1 Tax=Euplotes crassus TaxID=5936 RepID=A0AAD2D1L4_EUPCR|nr:unnamed protein product [Moneuplotes crassus]